ncbi:MAG: MMPL family transporter [Bacteroidota bacterium]
MNASKKSKHVGNAFARRWAEFVIRYKWPVLVLSLLLAVGLGSQGKLEFDGDYHVFFSESNPELEAFDALQEKYTKDDNIVLVLAPENGDIFTRDNLIAIEELTAEAWNTPYSSRVDAITNFQYTRAVGDDLYVDDLSYESSKKTDAEIAKIREIALKEPLLVHRIINTEGSVTAINITVRLPGENSATEIPEVTVATRKMIADFQEMHPEFTIYTTGLVPLNTAFFEHSEKDFTRVGMMILIVMVLTLLLTRNFFAMFSTLLVFLLSFMSTLGFVGLMGIKLTPPSAVFPTMILTLAVADSIHILITFLQKVRTEGYQKKAALIESMRLNFMPVFITSLTTVIGFLTMNFGDVPPFWDLGNIVAFGMIMAFTFSTTLLPALMAVFPIWKRKTTAQQSEKQLGWYTQLGLWVVGRPKAISLISLTIIGLLAYFATFNVFNDEFVEYFDTSVKFRQDSDFINENLTGFYNVEFSVGSGESGGINTPEYLSKLNAFEKWLEEQPEVVHVNAFSEVARRVNRSMHGDDDTYYKVPTDRQEAAQYLLLYELSLPFGLDLNNQINVDKSETRVTATLENSSSVEMIAFTERAEQWLRNNTPEAMHTIGVSPTLMFSRLGFRQADSMFNGNIIALLLISLVLMFALRNAKLGLLSIIPNVAPVLVGFGLWWLYKGTINTGMVIVFGMTLGIIVDDTVHFMSKFLRARRELGYDVRAAVIYAFETVGRALVTTTVVLIAGFAVLSTSPFALNSYMARITLIIISAALIIDFLLLPALLILINKKEPELLEASRKLSKI